MGIKFANNAQTLLNGSISDSATTITVDDATVFNSEIGGGDYSYISIDSEIMTCTGIAGNVLTVTRAVDGTTAAAHTDNARVQQNVTAGSLNDLAEDVDITATTLTMTNKTIDDVSNLIGADHVHYKIKANEALTKGDALKYVGWNLGESAIEVVKPTSAQDVVIGFVNEDISSGSFGLAINTGAVKDVDTSAYSDGAILYSDGAGGLTGTKPATGYYQELAFVFRSNLNNGVLLVECTATKDASAETKLDGIEALADVTDTTNVTAAGALMDSEVTNLAQVKAFDTTDYATAAQGTTADAALPKAGGTMTGTIAGFTSTGIDDNATSTAITIDASENVGIGVTPETWHNSYQALQVGGRAALAYDGQTTLTHNVYASTATGAPQYYIDSSVQPSRVRLTNTGTIDFSVAPSGTADTAITWTTPLTIANAGDVTVGTGNLVIGTSGKGIDFSAVSDGSRSVSSNILDDYEEGTWTPSIYGANNSAIRTNNGTGEYTKVGNKVTLWGRIVNPGSIIALDGAWHMDGLPFTVGMSYGAVSFGHKRGVPVVTNGTYMSGHLGSGITSISLYWALNTTGESVSITGSSPTNLLMGFSFSYHV